MRPVKRGRGRPRKNATSEERKKKFRKPSIEVQNACREHMRKLQEISKPIDASVLYK